jgi:beta-galactosidase
LFLNGQSLGSKARPADDSPRTWKVTFAPGTIKAVGKNKGEIAAGSELQTAGKPARILLTAEHSTLTPAWDDVDYVTAAVVDDRGVVIPRATDLITFKVEGPGHLAALETGNTREDGPFQSDHRHAFEGKCVAIMKATSAGPITITASAPSLESGTLTITAKDMAPPEGR